MAKTGGKTKIQAMILVGGLGTRLKDISKDMPKSMMPVKGIPFLEHVLVHLKRHRINEIILCVGHLHGSIENYFEDGSKWGIKINYSCETRQLGTGGAVKLAEQFVTGDNFMVLNGDSFLNCNPDKLMRFHVRNHALLTMALVEIEDTRRYGTVELNEAGRIIRFSEKTEISKSSLINAGLYVFNKQIFDYIPAGRDVSLEQEIFPKIIHEQIFGLADHSYFIDIGTPADYERAQLDFPGWRNKITDA